MQEECNECGEDCEAGSGDANGVEDETCVHGGIESIQAILDLVGPFYIGEVEMEGTEFQFFVQLLGDVEVVY